MCAAEKAFMRSLIQQLEERNTTLTAQVITLADPLAEVRRTQAKLQESRADAAQRPPDPNPLELRRTPPLHSPGLLRRARDVPPSGPPQPVLTTEQIEESFERR